MGVSLKNLEFGEVQPICSDCGVALCWSVDSIEYLQWKGFWDDWTCRTCNPDYLGAYQTYQSQNKPFNVKII